MQWGQSGEKAPEKGTCDWDQREEPGSRGEHLCGPPVNTFLTKIQYTKMGLARGPFLLFSQSQCNGTSPSCPKRT